MAGPSPELKWTSRPSWARAVVLVLPGGSERSHRAAKWHNTAVLRMAPVARAAADAGRDGFAVARLRYAVKGWNDDLASPVADATAALDEIGDRYPGLPIAVVGHSMGGRVALALAGDPRVSDVLALAPWVHPGDEVHQHDDVRVLVVHGLWDRITSAQASRDYVRELTDKGARASFVAVKNEGHAMLLRARAWDLLVQGFLRGTLGEDSLPGDDGYVALGARAARENVVAEV